MKQRQSNSVATKPLGRLLLAGCAAALSMAVTAQEGSGEITELTVVDLQLMGRSPTGPFSIVVEHDPGLATHTIYRPTELTMETHPVLVWGNGGCARNGLMFPDFLSEIASHGFVVIADGPPGAAGAGPGGPGGPGGAGGPGGSGAGGAGGAGGPPGGGPAPVGPAPGAGGPPQAGGGAPQAGDGAPQAGDGTPQAGGGTPQAGGGAPQAGGDAPGRPGPGAGNAMVNGTNLIAAMDWLEAEASDADSRFHAKVDTDNVAAMGMSCGGLMAYGASDDPRVATVGVWNSGLFTPDHDLYDAINGSVIIVTGGESDIAYANGKRDFEDMPEHVPVFYGVYPSVGHGGTYFQDNGGPYGIAAVAWLKWQVMGDTGETGRGYFIGESCGICRDPNWEIDSRSLR